MPFEQTFITFDCSYRIGIINDVMTARSKPKAKLLSKSKKPSALKKKISRIFFIAIFVLGILGLGAYRVVFVNFALANSATAYDLSSSSLYTLVVGSVDTSQNKLTQLGFVVIDKNTKKIVFFDIDPTISIDIPGRFGEETVFNSYKLSADASENARYDLVISSVKKLSGLNVDGYIFSDEKLSSNVRNLFIQGDTINITNLPVMWENQASIHTNLSTKSLVALNSFIKTLTSDRLIYKKVTQSYIASMDEDLQEYMLTSTIVSERKNIAVLNGSNIPGIATFGSRVALNAGGRVVASSNASTVYTSSFIVADDTNSETVSYLARFFDIHDVRAKKDLKGVFEDEIFSSDITVILGVDVAQRL